MSKEWTKWHSILLVIIIGVLVTSMALNYRDRKLLRECSTEEFGKIISLEKSRNKGYTAKVRYTVDSVTYESYDYVGVNHPYIHGNRVIVQVACKDPETIRVLRRVD